VRAAWVVWITKPHHSKLSSKPIPKTFGFFSMRDSLLCRVVLKHCEIADDGVSQSSSGAAIASILEEDKAYEIALCAGDDQTDESMFKLRMPRLLSVKVGNGSDAGAISGWPTRPHFDDFSMKQ